MNIACPLPVPKQSDVFLTSTQRFTITAAPLLAQLDNNPSFAGASSLRAFGRLIDHIFFFTQASQPQNLDY